MRIAHGLYVALLLLPSALSAQMLVPEESPFGALPTQNMEAIELRALNKVTARSSLLKVNLGDVIQFDALQVKVRTCWKSPPDQQPEDAALLRVVEEDPDEGQRSLFYGWMFASSPALNALEHPIYDLTVLRCLPNKVKAELVDAPLE